jgi:hypothetical protein
MRRNFDRTSATAVCGVRESFDWYRALSSYVQNGRNQNGRRNSSQVNSRFVTQLIISTGHDIGHPMDRIS